MQVKVIVIAPGRNWKWSLNTEGLLIEVVIRSGLTNYPIIILPRNTVYKGCRQNDKQCRPLSDVWRSSLIWVCTVCPDLSVDGCEMQIEIPSQWLLIDTCMRGLPSIVEQLSHVTELSTFAKQPFWILFLASSWTVAFKLTICDMLSIICRAH